MISRATSLRRLLPMLIALGFAAVATVPSSGEDEGSVFDLPLELQAVAANQSNLGPRGMTRIQMNVGRWSDAEERASLVEAMKQGGGRSLPDALARKERVGWIRQVSKISEDLRYSREIPQPDGGRVVVLALDRPIGFAEQFRGLRSTDYNVTLVTLTLDREGKGEGQLMLGAEFEWDAKREQLTITNLASEPIRLTQVSLR